MNWISNYVRPTINSFFSRRDVPENLWTKCDACGTMLFHRELAASLHVCGNCGHHMAIRPRDRFTALFDAGLFKEVAVAAPIADPLKFRDQKRYPDRLRGAQRSSGEAEAMLVAEGEIGRTGIVAAAQDFSFMAGSMGMYVGNAVIAAAERARATGRPLVLFSAAGGARMQEGILSLMQMPRSTVALQLLKEARLPYIVVLTNPTTGGVTASYAMLGDIQIAEPGALICFAGPRVIEQTIRETLPEGFQRAEYLLEHGMIDRVTPREQLRDELIGLVRMLMGLPPAIKGELPPPGEVPAAGAPARQAADEQAEAGGPADRSPPRNRSMAARRSAVAMRRSGNFLGRARTQAASLTRGGTEREAGPATPAGSLPPPGEAGSGVGEGRRPAGEPALEAPRGGMGAAGHSARRQRGDKGDAGG